MFSPSTEGGVCYTAHMAKIYIATEKHYSKRGNVMKKNRNNSDFLYTVMYFDWNMFSLWTASGEPNPVCLEDVLSTKEHPTKGGIWNDLFIYSFFYFSLFWNRNRAWVMYS